MNEKINRILKLQKSNDRDIDIFGAYYGLDSSPETGKEIGIKYGLTGSRVNQLAQRGLGRLTSYLIKNH